MITQIFTFVFKHLLLYFTKKQFTGNNEEILVDLKKKLKEQDEYIKYQTSKILELQKMVLNGRD